MLSRNIARIRQNSFLSSLTPLQRTPGVPQPQWSAGTSYKKQLHIALPRRWSQLNDLVFSEGRIKEQEKPRGIV